MRPRPPLVSQNGEDHLLLSAFDSQPRGFFIDVGAFDGVHLSNTWALEQNGWHGICIEPAPRLFPLLGQNRRRSVCIEAAVGAKSGEGTLYMDPTMLLSSLGPKEGVEAAYERAAGIRGLDTEEFQEVSVDLVTLDDLVRRSGRRDPIDLLSVDVEGAEPEVIDGFDLIHHRPRVIVIEANDDEAKSALKSRITKAGYTFCRALANNLFFSIDPALIQSLRWTTMDCFIPRNFHPFGLEYTHPDQRHDRVILRGQGFEIDELATLVRKEEMLGADE